MKKTIAIAIAIITTLAACGDDTTPNMQVDASSPQVDASSPPPDACPGVPTIISGVVKCSELLLAECLAPYNAETGFGLICEPHSITPTPCWCKSHLPTPWGDTGAWCMPPF